MSYWVCCNSCFVSPSTDRKLAITSCGHVICSACYQKGNQGECLICSSQCQVSPLSDKSSSGVKALFSDINVVATKHLTEVSKVIMFQARHQKRLLTYYQQRNEKLEEVLVKVKQEMQQMKRQLNEQGSYIAQLENSLQHQSAKASTVSQISRSSHTPQGRKPVLQISYNSPVSLSRHPSTTSIPENIGMGERSLFRKPGSTPRLSVNKPSLDGRMGTPSHRTSNQNLAAARSVRSATVSHFQGVPLSPEPSFSQGSLWQSPIFKPQSSFRHSMSSLIHTPP
ncbi:putative E3 SUMO-protein ligase RNF212 isoform 1-T1 [Menidia menidia]